MVVACLVGALYITVEIIKLIVCKLVNLVDSIVQFFTNTVAEETKPVLIQSWPGLNRGSLSLRNCRQFNKAITSERVLFLQSIYVSANTIILYEIQLS